MYGDTVIEISVKHPLQVSQYFTLLQWDVKIKCFRAIGSTSISNTLENRKVNQKRKTKTTNVGITYCL